MFCPDCYQVMGSTHRESMTAMDNTLARTFKVECNCKHCGLVKSADYVEGFWKGVAKGLDLNVKTSIPNLIRLLRVES